MTENTANEIDELELDESIFDSDVDVDEIPDNPNHIPEDTYTCRITKAELKLTKAKDKVGLTLTYQITEGQYATAFPFQEWLHCPRKPKDPNTGKVDKTYEWTPNEIRANSRLKKHFEAAGFGADEIATAKPSDLVGKFLKVRTKNKTNNNGMENIQVVGVLAISDGEGMNEFAQPNDDTDY